VTAASRKTPINVTLSTSAEGKSRIEITTRQIAKSAFALATVHASESRDFDARQRATVANGRNTNMVRNAGLNALRACSKVDEKLTWPHAKPEIANGSRSAALDA